MANSCDRFKAVLWKALQSNSVQMTEHSVNRDVTDPKVGGTLGVVLSILLLLNNFTPLFTRGR